MESEPKFFNPWSQRGEILAPVTDCQHFN